MVGVKGILQVYRETLRNGLIMSGLRDFSGVIRAAGKDAKEEMVRVRSKRCFARLLAPHVVSSPSCFFLNSRPMILTLAAFTWLQFGTEKRSNIHHFTRVYKRKS